MASAAQGGIGERRRTRLSRLSLWDALGLIAGVAIPLVAKGLLLRRRRVVALLTATGGERRAVARLVRLREKHGAGPLMLRLPLRRQAVLLAPAHVRRVLDETPFPFAADSDEKKAALAHFQPDGVLISSGGERRERRALNEKALETGCPMHSLAGPFTAAVESETAALLAETAGALDWPRWRSAWYRMARTVVLGAGARDDAALTDDLDRLRGDANWAFLKPRRHRFREQVLARIDAALATADPGSLGARLCAEAGPGGAPADQVAHWLFAMDAGAMASYRTLAMLALHPQAARRARAERADVRPFLRACLLDTLRLWPTTPAILRQSRAATLWEAGEMAAGTGLLIHLPYLHRDRSRLPFADRFAPDAWLDGTAEAATLIPFSAGPAACPARELVLMLTAAWLAALLRHRDFAIAAGGGPLDPARLPATFDPFALRLAARPHRTSLGAGTRLPARGSPTRGKENIHG